PLRRSGSRSQTVPWGGPGEGYPSPPGPRPAHHPPPPRRRPRANANDCRGRGPRFACPAFAGYALAGTIPPRMSGRLPEHLMNAGFAQVDPWLALGPWAVPVVGLVACALAYLLGRRLLAASAPRKPGDPSCLRTASFLQGVTGDRRSA